MQIHIDPPWLLVKFDRPHNLLSWSINRPGYVVTEQVAWLQVENRDLPPDLDPKQFLCERLQERNLSDAVAFMTSRDITSWQDESVRHGGVECRGVMTLDLGNGSHVGFPNSHAAATGVGTINLLCQLSEPLNRAAMLEGISILTQGRTAALTEMACTPRAASQPVTGTGTDCIAIACPVSQAGAEYAGLHTAIGKVLGSCAYNLTKKTATEWMMENGL
jgi:adenosylcobinamide amidohydrolase